MGEADSLSSPTSLGPIGTIPTVGTRVAATDALFFVGSLPSCTLRYYLCRPLSTFRYVNGRQLSFFALLLLLSEIPRVST